MKTFRFEHRGEKVATLPQFYNRLWRYGLFSAMLITVSLAIGVTGYHFLGNLNLVDSIHMSSMILTGMGPVAEMNTDIAKLFSSFYALYSGVAFLSIVAVFIAPVVHRFLHILHVEKETDAR